jgi:hypothetical protein
VWRAVGIFGQVVLALDAIVHRGETHFVAVEGRCPLVVDNAERVVLRLAGGLAVSKPVNAVVNVVGGAFDGLLNEIRVQTVGFVAEVVVDGVFSFTFLVTQSSSG